MADQVDAERDELGKFIADAIAGRGWSGPTRDVAVIARRLIESERVRVDVPGRRTVAEVADLALRCGRAETALAAVEAALDAVTKERDSLAAAFRSQTGQAAAYLEQIKRLELQLAMSPRVPVQPAVPVGS